MNMTRRTAAPVAAALGAMLSAQQGLPSVRRREEETVMEERSGRTPTGRDNHQQLVLSVLSGERRALCESNSRVASVQAAAPGPPSKGSEAVLDAAEEQSRSEAACELEHRFLSAVERKDLTEVRRLLEEGSELMEARNKDGLTALLVAARARDGHQVVEVLLGHTQTGTATRRTTDVDATDGLGRTALHLACLGGNAQTTRLLLRAGADPKKRDTRRGATPTHYAAAFARLDSMRLLLAYAESRGYQVVDDRDHLGRSPLHWAALAAPREWGKKHAVEVARALVDKGADCSARDKMGVTPTHIAARLGAADFVNFLVQHADAPASREKQQRHAAILQRGNAVVTQCAFGGRALLHAADNRGLTPVDIAVARYHATRFKLRFLWKYWPEATGLAKIEAALLIPRRPTSNGGGPAAKAPPPENTRSSGGADDK